MRLFQKLNDAIRGNKSRTTVAKQELSGQMFLSPLCSTYENIFPQVRPLIDAFKEVHPYGLGRNGARLPLARTPELAILEDPNEEMGWSEFMDLAFAMWLTESELNIHVWMSQRGRVYGYTILPAGSRVSLGNGDYYFQSLSSDGGTEQIPKEEVMTLRYSRNPRDIQKGVSPAQTVFVQTQIADLMYQYQRAYLENGAVPAYITIIRASTKEKFEEAKRDFERSFKGANNKGKTAFLWRQFLDDGSEKDQVEVKTIQPNNSTLAIKEIMSIVKDDFNKAFGVSEFILGNDSSAKYDNAELSQQQFMLHRVKPALSSFWSQFQHELERVRGGGLGYAIGYDLHIEELTDRLKVKAEIAQKNVENLTSLINAGSTARAAVMALGLSEEWLDVAYGLYSEKQSRASLSTPSVDSNLLNKVLDALDGKSRHLSDISEPTSDIATSIDGGNIGQNLDNQGWIGATTEPLAITSLLNDELKTQLYDGELNTETTNIPAQENPHFTVFYGLTREGMETHDIDLSEILEENLPSEVVVDKIDIFDNNDNYKIIVAKLKKTDELQRLHNEFLALDHYPQEFSEYTPHITLCYIKKDAIAEDFIRSFCSYVGKVIKTTGFQIDNPWRKNIDHFHRSHICHHTHDAKDDVFPNFTAEETTEKAIYEELEKVLQSTIAEVLGEGAVLSEEDMEKLKEVIIAQLIEQADAGADDAAMQIQGFVLGTTAKEIAGILENGGYHVSEDFTEKLAQRTEDIISNLSEDAKTVAREVLNAKKKEGLTVQQIAKELADIMPKARAELIARNETVYAFRAGSFENTKHIADKYNLEIRKTWRCHEDDRTCEICRSMNGQTVGLDSAFTDSVEGKDGVTYAWEHTKWNDNGEVTCAHPRCRCYMEYEVING